jgi:hypothetical protein
MIFCSAQAVLHFICFNRNIDVADNDVIGQIKVPVWVRDCLPG